MSRSVSGEMRERRETVEGPFATIKERIGATHFLTKTLPKVDHRDAPLRARIQSHTWAEYRWRQAADGGDRGLIRPDFGLRTVPRPLRPAIVQPTQAFLPTQIGKICSKRSCHFTGSTAPPAAIPKPPHSALSHGQTHSGITSPHESKIDPNSL